MISLLKPRELPAGAEDFDALDFTLSFSFHFLSQFLTFLTCACNILEATSGCEWLANMAMSCIRCTEISPVP